MDGLLNAEGWEVMDDQGFGSHVGPLWRRRRGCILEFGMRIASHHMNIMDRAHGGMLATLADSALGWTIMDALDAKSPSVTVQLDLQFLDAVLCDEFINSSARIVRRSRHLVFAEGGLWVGEKPVLRASGIWKVPRGNAGVDRAGS